MASAEGVGCKVRGLAGGGTLFGVLILTMDMSIFLRMVLTSNTENLGKPKRRLEGPDLQCS